MTLSQIPSALKLLSSTLIAEFYSSLKVLEQCILAAPGSFFQQLFCAEHPRCYTLTLWVPFSLLGLGYAVLSFKK